MASCDVGMMSDTKMTTPSTIQDNRDVLQKAIEAHATFDLQELASLELDVVEFVQTQCFYLEEAKFVLQQHSQGEDVSASDKLVINHYVPFLVNYRHYQEQQQYPEGEMAPGVSYFSAGICLDYLMTHSQDSQDPLLSPLFSLPNLPEQQLVQMCLMLIHARSCQKSSCDQPFCSGLKTMLSTPDVADQEFRMTVQLERHMRRNKDNPNDSICSQIRRHIELAEETQRRLAASALSGLAKKRDTRSYSMPPAVEVSTASQSQPKEQQDSPHKSSAAFSNPNLYSSSFPSADTSARFGASNSDAAAGRRRRSKAVSMPPRPQLDMQVDEDETS